MVENAHLAPLLGVEPALASGLIVKYLDPVSPKRLCYAIAFRTQGNAQGACVCIGKQIGCKSVDDGGPLRFVAFPWVLRPAHCDFVM